MGQQHGKRTRRKFSDEFKRDALALVVDWGRQIAEVAAELGRYDSTSTVGRGSTDVGLVSVPVPDHVLADLGVQIRSTQCRGFDA